jgi:hypothetical protein
MTGMTLQIGDPIAGALPPEAIERFRRLQQRAGEAKVLLRAAVEIEQQLRLTIILRENRIKELRGPRSEDGYELSDRVDLAKNVFQVHGVDSAGKVVITRQLRRYPRHVFSRDTLEPMGQTGVVFTAGLLQASHSELGSPRGRTASKKPPQAFRPAGLLPSLIH